MKNNTVRKRNIAAVGDVWIDRVLASGENGNKLDVFTLPGGALLIKDIITAFPDENGNIEVESYPVEDLDSLSNREIIHSLSEGLAASGKDGPEETYYIKRFLGYPGPGPDNGVPGFVSDFSIKSRGEHTTIIIDDAGSGSRDDENAWNHILEYAGKNKNTAIVYNMSEPLFEGKLWEKIAQKDLFDRMILIINGNALRKDGVNISRKLSWDRTAADFLTIPGYKKYDQLRKCPHILVRFGLECVIYYYRGIEEKNEYKRKLQVFYIPNRCEDETIDSLPGTMKGLDSAFAGFLGLYISTPPNMPNDLTERLIKAVPTAAGRVVQTVEMGYIKDDNRLSYPFENVFRETGAGLFKTLDLRDLNMGYFESMRRNWRILSHRIPLDYALGDIAMEYVKNGSAKELENVPVVQFGKLLTVDNSEIENFRGIRNLIKEYLGNTKLNKPLSIAVFGPPGSGKSFAVKNAADSAMGGKGRKEVLEYNISQFESPLDIVRAFHEVRDYTLTGAAPLVFFDEFDSSYKSQPLGWLKYFLAPMQDGEFKEGEKTHPIGRAIFVFAGGTSRSLKEFSREDDAKKQDNGDDFQRFIEAKGPDFVSRLKGYVDILGPNPIDLDTRQDAAPFRDRFFVIRRAVLLRAILLQQKAIVDDNKKISIDDDVLRSLLMIPKYKHGARSMSAIVNMSMFEGRTGFEKAALPSPEQLRLHLDPGAFMNILDRDLIVKTASLDRAIHEIYQDTQREQAGSKPGNQIANTGWDDLGEDIKQLNLMLARNIPFYLLWINCSYRPKTGNPGQEQQPGTLTGEEIEYLARMAHERWCHEKRSDGWIYGDPRDDDKKLHNCLVLWEQLPDELKKIDRNTMKSIPRILDRAGFEIYRLD
jgi:hypothetical protein